MVSVSRPRWMATSFVFAVIAAPISVALAEPASTPRAGSESPGLAQLSSAAVNNRYSYVFFWKHESEATRRQLELFKSVVATIADQADAVTVCVADPDERATVEAFKVSRAPMPLVLAVAPNGAVTKAWPTNFTAEAARDGLVSEGMAACMKALQDDKLVLVSVQNASTASGRDAMQAALGFLEDPRFGEAAELVVIDPANRAEGRFLADLKVPTAPREAVTVVLAPPGRTVATFVGVVSAKELAAKVTDAAAGCCPDGKCGPGQCCPGGKCGPLQKK